MRFKSFSLDIIDLVGIMFPGVIWASLFYLIHVLYPNILSAEIKNIWNNLNTSFQGSHFILNTFIFLFSSYILGYISRLFPTNWLDWLTLPIAHLRSGKKLKESRLYNFKSKLYPYDFMFDSQRKNLENIFKDLYEFVGNSGYVKTLFLIKRFLLHSAPNLWENARRREAEIKFINSMFYLSFVVFVLFLTRGNLITSLFFFLFLLFWYFTFRRRRYAEVSFIYGSTFISLVLSKSEIPKPLIKTK